MNGKNCDKFWVPVTNVTGVTLKCHKNVTFAKNGPNGPKFGGPVRINSSNKAAKFGGPTATYQIATPWHLLTMHSAY